MATRCISLINRKLRVENISEHLVKLDSGYPENGTQADEKGAKGAKMGEPLAIKAVFVLLLLSAIVKLVGTRFRTQD